MKHPRKKEVYIIQNLYNNYIFIKYFTVEDKDPSKNIDSQHEDDIR